MIGSTNITRRRLLGNGARLAGAALAASVLPPNLRRALAQTSSPPAGSLKDIKHVVFLMQENRSFDHYFGTMAGVRGFGDPNAMKLSTGRSVFYQPDEMSPDGYLLPFHLNTRKTNAQKVPSTDHSWEVQHEAWNEGKMDRWLAAHRKADGVNGAYTMGYYTRTDIPFQFALAEAFTICDSYHSSVMGPTWPNRMHWMTGTIDPDGKNGGPIIFNRDNAYRWTTYPERLEKAGISWKVYQQFDHSECNVLQKFKQFREAGVDSPLLRNIVSGERGEFERDAVNDQLPTVSWIIPSSEQSEHPDHLPAEGAAFVASKVDAIAANPDVWAKTAFILNYDENDGIFDHVAPPVPPKGTDREFVEGVPIGGGFRVPCVIVSPWTAGGWVCSEMFDHTSMLRFLEKMTGIAEPNISDWRRKTFGDLTSAFRFDEGRSQPPVMPDTGGQLAMVKAEVDQLPWPVAPAEQKLPVQEAGERKRVPKV